jgi:hypothetical protein|tara:strand:+ start:750 stop:851 length:102 start_codon:yes stop_codon:yes gene_type:complete
MAENNQYYVYVGQLKKEFAFTPKAKKKEPKSRS